MKEESVIRVIADRPPVVELLWLISCRCENGLVTIFTHQSRLLFARTFKVRSSLTTIDHFVLRNTYLRIVKCLHRCSPCEKMDSVPSPLYPVWDFVQWFLSSFYQFPIWIIIWFLIEEKLNHHCLKQTYSSSWKYLNI